MMVAVTRAVWWLLPLATNIHALRAVAGSPCTSVCGTTTNTTSNEIVCVDSYYNTTQAGRNFKSCVSCLLDSPFQNTTSGETDVDWGLFNLRYAFSSCVYNYPRSVTNVSTPCLVSCTPLGPALEMQLNHPVGNSLSTFCGSSSFPDNVVTVCENCYGRDTAQGFLANFLEAVRYNCHFPTPGGVSFSVAASRIFNRTQLPSTNLAYGSTSTPTPGSSTVQKYLTVIIVMPIIGFLIIVASLTLCCCCLVKHRRKLAKERRLKMHNRWAPGTVFNPQWQPAWASHPTSPYQQASPLMQANPMMQQQQQQYMAGGVNPYGVTVPGTGFQVVDHDGKRYEAGYSTHYISPVSPVDTKAQQPFQFGTDTTTHTQDTKQSFVQQDEIHPSPPQVQQQEHQEYYSFSEGGGPHAV